MKAGLLSNKVHQWWQFGAFALIAIGMPTTKVLMSFGLVFAIANWLLEGDFKSKWQTVKQQQVLLILVAFYVLIIIGTTWSWDVHQGIKDLKSRLPLLVLPLVMATGSPLSSKQTNAIIYLFLTALTVTSLFNFIHYQFINQEINQDIRSLSFFASHIRYGMLIVIGLIWCVVQFFQQKSMRFVYGLLTAWFLFYTFYSQILSAISSLMVCAFLVVLYLLFKWKIWVGVLFLIITIGLSAWGIYHISVTIQHEHDCSTFATTTKQGNLYSHDCSSYSEINEQPVLAYYAEEELKTAWLKRTDSDFFGVDANGELLRLTLARYMTSLNLKKDAEGLNQLTDEDIQNIENGYVYRNQKNELIKPLLNRVRYQLINHQDPNGHSLLQRIEHWKASLRIIQKNGFYGVGTGGNQKAFDQEYQEMSSALRLENRHRSHNQFFAILISYGWLGIALFLTLLLAIFKLLKQKKDVFSTLVFVIITSSFFIEDTLETQLGVTIFGFFLAFSLSSGLSKKIELPKK